jgi:hypothetical protein
MNAARMIPCPSRPFAFLFQAYPPGSFAVFVSSVSIRVHPWFRVYSRSSVIKFLCG